MFSYQIIFSLKIFHVGPQGLKHGKFKSKKQNFTNFKFLQSEPMIDPNEGLQRKEKSIEPKMNEKWQFKGFQHSVAQLRVPLVAKISVCRNFRSRILDILTSKTIFFKSWSFVAGSSPTQIEISNKKSYTLTKVFCGCSKKANQLIQHEGKPVEPV